VRAAFSNNVSTVRTPPNAGGARLWLQRGTSHVESQFFGAVVEAYQRHRFRTYQISTVDPVAFGTLRPLLDLLSTLHRESSVPFEIVADGAMRSYLSASSKYRDGGLEAAHHPLGWAASHYLGVVERGARIAIREHRRAVAPPAAPPPPPALPQGNLAPASGVVEALNGKAA
jgi:hypothetical protein